MKQRLWPVTGSSREELRQMLIDNIVQATLEPEPKRRTREERESRERMVEALFLAAAADAEGR